MRISYSDEEEHAGQFALWQANCQRSLAGKKGQVALRELEKALVALPDKRLIADRLVDAQGEVCALGALGRYKVREMVADAITEGEWEDEGDEDMEEFGVSLGVPRLVAWKIVELNDIQIDGHYEIVAGPPRYGYIFPRIFVPVTPEERYEKVLAWARNHIQRAES